MPCRAARTATETRKKPSSTIRATAPAIGTHLPMRTDCTTASAPPRMKTSPAAYFQPPGSGVKNSSQVVRAMMHRLPPTQTGLEIQ